MKPDSRDDAADEEWDRLAAALNGYGVCHIAPLAQPGAGILDAPIELFLQLARAREVRLREAAILLLLTHPGLAPAAQEAIRSLAGAERDRAVRRYVAAAALHRMWRTRVELALGRQPSIPPAYLDELELPPLEDDYGRATLWALAAGEEARYGYDAWATYTSLMDLFLAEIELKGWGRLRARPERGARAG